MAGCVDDTTVLTFTASDFEIKLVERTIKERSHWSVMCLAGNPAKGRFVVTHMQSALAYRLDVVLEATSIH
jgi:hypothetical protein